jgi:phosphate ABC transporter phosphate-binding protein
MFLVALAGPGAGSAAAGTAHALIQGSGSSWAANAVNQWIADVQSNGLQVVFTSQGSAQGRKDFANDTVDFAVSDIGFQGYDPVTQSSDTSNGRAYAYLPIVAGGTALTYQIRVGGQLVRNLRLSGLTIAKIFTNQITNWNDPAITKDNNGHPLPSLPIIPVVHSEGSGSTYQFTRYLDREYHSIWHGFAGIGATEYFPRQGGQVAENGSDSVMNFIASNAANGAIGYDEYSYALGAGYPAAKVLNSAGYYTLPNQYNVAVALTRAQINMDKASPDYLLQNLDNVYVYNDPRVYPMSSYSYAIIPTSATDPKMTTAKRQTLADYLYLSVCQGQRQMGPIGYSPLPINLVEASFQQINLLHQADPGVDLSNENVTTCHNPTFIPGQPKVNYLARIAPLPPACDKAGAGPCTGNGNTGQQNPVGGKVPVTSQGSGATTGTGTQRTGTGGLAPGSGGGAAQGTGTGTGLRLGTGTGAGAVNADGQYTGAGGGGNAGVAVGDVKAAELPAAQSPSTSLVLALIAGALLIAVLVAPPLVARAVASRKPAP